MVVTGARDTHRQFAAELKTDMGAFVWWIIALGLIGSLGYVKALAPFSKAFLVLVILVMILAQSRNGTGGFFEQLNRAIQAGPEHIPTPDKAPITNTAKWSDYTNAGDYGSSVAVKIPTSTNNDQSSTFTKAVGTILPFLF
jgi:hypothetical protein